MIGVFKFVGFVIIY